MSAPGPHPVPTPRGRVPLLAPFFARAALALALVGALGGHALRADDYGFDDTDYLEAWSERDKGVGWNISVGLTGGYTTPLKGYEDYEGMGSGGVDVYFRPPVPLFPKWRDTLAFRLSMDYVPLQTPEDVYGVTHDIWALNGTLLYRFINFARGNEHTHLVPFLGAGVGLYADRITLEHPALTEKTKSNRNFMGFSGSAGIMFPSIGKIRLIPEVRYHTMKQDSGFWASYISYQIGAVYWLPSRVEE